MFKLIDLPYTLDALEPVISARTLEFHHGKHLQGYVDNLNKLLPGSAFEKFCQPELSSCHSEREVCHSERSEESQLVAIVKASSLPAPTGNPAVFNNAGQILNHNLYFQQFRSFVADAPQDDKGSHSEQPVCHSDRGVCHSERPVCHSEHPVCHSERPVCHSERSEESPLIAQIRKQWGSVDAFQAEFEQKGVTLFGSGWVWLQADASGELSIAQYPGADNPVAHGFRPLLTFDVWEHAYYLDYQNRRAAHLKALWQIVDWRVIEKRYETK